MVYQTSDFRNGLKVEMNGTPYEVVYFQFVKPGKGTAFTRTKLKNMISGAVLERTFRTGETIKAADIVEITTNYLYNDGEFFVFMDMESFEQVFVSPSTIKDEKDFLTENLEVSILLFESRPVSIGLPNFIEDEITYCEPGIKGNTATGATKPATLSCGAEINVPLFVENGDHIKVDTRTKSYVQRVSR
jgi:elongation factor P